MVAEICCQRRTNRHNDLQAPSLPLVLLAEQLYGEFAERFTIIPFSPKLISVTTNIPPARPNFCEFDASKIQIMDQYQLLNWDKLGQKGLYWKGSPISAKQRCLMVHWHKRKTKRQRPYQVRLLEMNGKDIIRIIASRDFKAVGAIGARRASSHWYRRLYPGDIVAGAHTPWEVQSSHASESKTEFHFCQTEHGLLAFHATDRKDVAKAVIEEKVEEADPDEVMRQIQENPDKVRKDYRGRGAVLLGIMERYFSYTNPQVGSFGSTVGKREADLVYDWPGAPQMLARAWRTEQKYIRRILHKDFLVECTVCGKQYRHYAHRVPGGFDYSASGKPCLICGNALIEINPGKEDLHQRHVWRTPQSPYWIAPNPAQEINFAVQRMNAVMREPHKYVAAGWMKGDKHAYLKFVKKLIAQVDPHSRILQYSVPRPPKRGGIQQMGFILKDWASALGKEDFKFAKQREDFIFETIRGTSDWLLFEHAENLGGDFQKRLRGMDREKNRPTWSSAFRMIWLWSDDSDHYPVLLGSLRRKDLDRQESQENNPSDQILWLPDPHQVLSL